MPGVFIRGSKLLVALALAFSLGAHWALLQGVAWVGMTLSYAQDSSLSDALQKTFDGKHRCKLCKLVDEGKKSEQKESTTVEKQKLDGIGQETIAWLIPPAPTADGFAAAATLRSLSEPPPLPPPRVA